MLGAGRAKSNLLIRDVGAAAVECDSESIAHSDRGGRIDLRQVPSDELGMSPLEIWCNEAYVERYVLIIAQDQLQRFAELCKRELFYAVVGDTTTAGSRSKIRCRRRPSMCR